MPARGVVPHDPEGQLTIQKKRRRILFSLSTSSHRGMRGRGVFVKQVIKKCGEFVRGELRRHDDVRYRPLLAFRADEEELPPPIGSFCSHHATKHIEQDGFGLLLAHAFRLVSSSLQELRSTLRSLYIGHRSI